VQMHNKPNNVSFSVCGCEFDIFQGGEGVCHSVGEEYAKKDVVLRVTGHLVKQLSLMSWQQNC